MDCMFNQHLLYFFIVFVFLFLRERVGGCIYGVCIFISFVFFSFLIFLFLLFWDEIILLKLCWNCLCVFCI